MINRCGLWEQECELSHSTANQPDDCKCIGVLTRGGLVLRWVLLGACSGGVASAGAPTGEADADDSGEAEREEAYECEDEEGGDQGGD